MNLYVGCINGVGKTTIAEKNDIFVDLDFICPYKIITLNKKKVLLQNILNLNNKIILFNAKIQREKNYQQKNYIFLNIKNIAKDLKTRIKKREIKRSILNSLKKEEILTIGDQNNDIALLQAGGLKIAMGNATDELKKIADHITDSVYDDGFVRAMEKFCF